MRERAREVFYLGCNRRIGDGIGGTKEEYVENLILEMQRVILGRVDRRKIARMIEVSIVRDDERVKMINEMVGNQKDVTRKTVRRCKRGRVKYRVKGGKWYIVTKEGSVRLLLPGPPGVLTWRR